MMTVMRRTPRFLPLLIVLALNPGFTRASQDPAGSATGTSLPAPSTLAPGARVWMHAHNCYPEEGRWADRLARALSVGLPWVAIEQDLVWVPATSGAAGRSVVAHDTPARGDEPTFERHLFDRIRPLLDRALEEDRRDTWPLITVSLDFKTNEPDHHRFVWALLGQYQRYLTTAIKRDTLGLVSPFTVGPLLVLTESGPGQEDAFFTNQPVGGTLRVFGTVPGPELDDRAKKQRHRLPATQLIPSGVTDYRRWVNIPWSAVEEGGAREAGPWTRAEAARLRTLVTHAHEHGLWIRFYAVNGHARGAGLGWSDSYNVGSADAARVRWRAARDAGVDFMATDQYEAFARSLTSASR